MISPGLSPADCAQLAMMLEVCARGKPGNVDRCHDYPDTRLEHFLASMIYCRPVLDRAEELGGTVGDLIREATILTTRHRGGNTHFGAFILLIPLLIGQGIPGALSIIRQTSVDDAILFYDAFSHCAVRVRDSDELDVNDPGIADKLRDQGMTLYDVMAHSAPHDMVAREWTDGFRLTRQTADALFDHHGTADIIPVIFLDLLSTETDTFIEKKFGTKVAREIRDEALRVKRGELSLEALDDRCIREGINPGSLADIMIAGIYLALTEGWEWDR
jgi:triphosphoribosyl-dephospho-CoA synthase